MQLGLIEKAAAIAATGHQGQYRKHGKVPYIVHPFMVARILTKHGFRDEVVAAGLVHDVLEDTDMTAEELERELGDEVVTIVKGLSEDKNLPWEARKQGYIELVRNASTETKAVSCADKTHNMTNMLHAYQTMGDALWEAFNRSPEKRLWFERSVLLMYDASGFKHELVEEYRDLVTQFENVLT